MEDRDQRWVLARNRARADLARRFHHGDITEEEFIREWDLLHPPSPQEPDMARDYLALIGAYLDGSISASEFRSAYWLMRRRWLDRDVYLQGEHGRVIDSFDTDVDAFSADPDVAWHEIDEHEPRRCAERAREALVAYLSG